MASGLYCGRRVDSWEVPDRVGRNPLRMLVTLAQRPRRFARKPAPMQKFLIEGGVPLSGTVTPAGNKNAALPLLACALLTDEDVTLHNVPAIRDTEALLELLEDLGVTVERLDRNTVKMNAANVTKTHVDAGLAERIRA